MNIAIVGTRGIPNRYGGFEQFAQHLALELSKMDFNVIVYAPSYRNDVKEEWNFIRIKKIKFPKYFGSLYHFVYDFLSIRNAIKLNADAILVCGYVTALPAILWYRKYAHKMLIHTDGFEWKRKKWNKFIQLFIRYAEKTVAKQKVQLVADHIIIQKYFLEKYKQKVHCIAYGCDTNIDFKPIKFSFFLVIARNEKENQIELILESFISSNTESELWIFTNKPVPLKYKHPKIKVLLNVYDEQYLNNIRFNALAYIHAYTVGGTNPSLIEAIGHCKLIVAYDNEFHRDILSEKAIYFKNKNELIDLMKKIEQSDISYREEYQKVVREKYQWSSIANQYVSIFKTMTAWKK